MTELTKRLDVAAEYSGAPEYYRELFKAASIDIAGRSAEAEELATKLNEAAADESMSYWDYDE
jgi:hypothetical protein